MTASLLPATVGSTLALGALVAHAAVPWLLRHRRSRHRLRRYDRATMLLALCAALAIGTGPKAVTVPWGEAFPVNAAWPVPPVAEPLWKPAILVVAAAAGGALPWAAARCTRRPLRRRHGGLPRAGRRERAANSAYLVGCAVGEEILWRMAGPAALTALGAPLPSAIALCLAAFCLLHVPNSGRRSLPYVALTAVLFTTAATAGGLPAAALAHIAHNTVLALAAPVRRDVRRRDTSRPVEEVPHLPAPSGWD
ncbi:type II CAAX prenyl endopeptidase Rce1 family protein [Streptomyces platensis]|uniref:CPBP family glutamic-type intramembrane protease n=1 Tax=Streptomyces platensis TaxID=58346 RepID=UPI003C3090A8